MLGAVVVGGIAYAAWRRASRPGTPAHRFVETVRAASAQREAELRDAVVAMEEADHATPYSDASAARGEGLRPGLHAAPAPDRTRSLDRDEARELLLDPTGRRATEGHRPPPRD